MDFNNIIIEDIQAEIKSLNDNELVAKYELSCCSGRTAPKGITSNGYYFSNGEYIKFLVNEIKNRNLLQFLSAWDLNHDGKTV